MLCLLSNFIAFIVNLTGFVSLSTGIEGVSKAQRNVIARAQPEAIQTVFTDILSLTGHCLFTIFIFAIDYLLYNFQLYKLSNFFHSSFFSPCNDGYLNS
jgi:hypothetical protein